MGNSLQRLKGEVARVRSECDYFLRLVDDLDRLADHRPYIDEEHHQLIDDATGRYSPQVAGELERAASFVAGWAQAVRDAIQSSGATRYPT